MESLNQLDPSLINDIFQNSTTSLIPESLINTIQTAILTITILGVLFLVLYVFTIVRKWKVDTAILQMQRDVAQIKNHMNSIGVNKNTEASVQEKSTQLEK